MKKTILGILILLFVSISFCGCTNTEPTGTHGTEEVSFSENPVLNASENYVNMFASIMNKGYSIVDKNKVYYTQSKDFSKMYFVGTVVKKGDQLYNAIWATNDIEFIGLIFSVNDYALQSSGMGDGRTNKEPITQYDDGYSRINQLLLADMQKELNQ